MNVFNKPGNASSKTGKMGEADGDPQSSEEVVDWTGKQRARCGQVVADTGTRNLKNNKD